MNKGMSRQGTKDEKAMSNVGKSLTKEDDKEKKRKSNIHYTHGGAATKVERHLALGTGLDKNVWRRIVHVYT